MMNISKLAKRIESEIAKGTVTETTERIVREFWAIDVEFENTDFLAYLVDRVELLEARIAKG